MRNTHGAMPAHLLPPERAARPAGVLALSVGVAILAFVALDGQTDDGTTLIRPVGDTSTEASVLGEVIERTTLPAAPPASPATVPSTDGSPTPSPSPRSSGGRPPPTTAGPGPTLLPPVSITAPPSTTTTTAPTTTTTEAPTTTTEAPTTTTEPPP